MMRQTLQRALPVRGIKNHGNTCFLNVVLQSLVSVRSFHDYLRHAPQPSRAVLSRELLTSFRNLAGDNSEPYDPTPLLRAVPVLQNTFSEGQHDPEELLQYLMSTLDEEKDGYYKEFMKDEQSAASAFSRSKLQEKERAMHSVEEERDGPSPEPLGNPFLGCLASTVTCISCKYKRTQEHKFIDLSLTIPPTNGQSVPVESCLGLFTSAEQLNGVRCDRCVRHRQQENLTAIERMPFEPDVISLPQLRGKIAKKSNWLKEIPAERRTLISATLGDTGRWSDVVKGVAEKTLKIDKIPKALCLHIQRLKATRKGGRTILLKDNTHVRFEENLDLSPYLLEHQMESVIYGLVAVIVHEDSILGSHFTVYRKVATDWIAKWFHINDEVAKEVSKQTVLEQPAYMLFYEKA